VVKDAITRYAARHLPPARARERIREAATRAVRRALQGDFKPFLPKTPLELEVEFANSACADAAELVPGSRRSDGVTLGYTAPDAGILLRVFRAWILLASTTLV
jgi:D-amino peptidase